MLQDGNYEKRELREIHSFVVQISAVHIVLYVGFASGRNS